MRHGKPYNLLLCDIVSPGDITSYQNCNVILVCFSVVSQESLDYVKQQVLIFFLLGIYFIQTLFSLNLKTSGLNINEIYVK